MALPGRVRGTFCRLWQVSEHLAVVRPPWRVRGLCWLSQVAVQEHNNSSHYIGETIFFRVCIYIYIYLYQLW